MGPSFNEQFDQHGAWRRAFAQQLKRLGQWMGSHDLMDAAATGGEVPALETTLDEQLVAAMEGVVRDERGLRFEREESD